MEAWGSFPQAWCTREGGDAFKRRLDGARGIQGKADVPPREGMLRVVSGALESQGRYVIQSQKNEAVKR